MLEENKTVKLKDNELEKVAGGYHDGEIPGGVLTFSLYDGDPQVGKYYSINDHYIIHDRYTNDVFLVKSYEYGMIPRIHFERYELEVNGTHWHAYMTGYNEEDVADFKEFRRYVLNI